MVLVNALRAEAVARGLFDSGASLGAAEAFYLVRDMPYKRASSRAPLTTIREWRGTCSGKHYLLKAVYEELGFKATLMACTQHVQAGMVARMIPAVKRLLEEGPIPDVHNYLELEVPGGRMNVDATFPLDFARYGLPVNETFTWGESMKLACDPILCVAVPDGEDPQAFKDRLLREHFTARELARREAFFTALDV